MPAVAILATAPLVDLHVLVPSSVLTHCSYNISSNFLVTGVDDPIRANSWADMQGLPTFAVGTPNVPRDMLANIHRGEMIVPATFSEGVRNGSVTLGSQASLVEALQVNNSLLSGIISKQDQQIQILLESRDIQNASVIELENIGGII